MIMDQDFKDLAFNAFLDKQDSSLNIPAFSATNSFVSINKESHYYLSRRCHLKRHPTIEERVANSLIKVIKIDLSDYPKIGHNH